MHFSLIFFFMRCRRIKGSGLCYYHTISRVVDRAFRFGELEKNVFRSMMWKIAAFSGVEIITYAIMSNHFHILVRVPVQQEISDEVFINRLQQLYTPAEVAAVQKEMEDVVDAALVRQRYTARMNDISAFMKTLKQRFSIWYNRNHERVGTLWEDRFKSVLIEAGDSRNGAVAVIADYINLNPVRAGIVKDPEHYAWSGFGEACAGNIRAIQGAALFTGNCIRPDKSYYEQLLECYKAIYARTTTQTSENNAQSTMLCTHRIRYFTDGLVIGGQSFLEKIFHENRSFFGSKRHTGARRLKDSPWDNLFSARALRNGPLIPSSNGSA